MGNSTLVAVLHRGQELVVTCLVVGGGADLIIEAQSEHGIATAFG